MFTFKLRRRVVATRLAYVFFLSVGLASCGGSSSSSDKKSNADVARPESTQTDSDYRTGQQAGLFLIAGNTGSPGFIDGAGQFARFNQPTGLAFRDDGHLYVADSKNHVIRKISESGTVTTVSGTAGHPGSADGSATEARFSALSALASDRAGNLYATDLHAIRRISPQGNVTTVAGMQQHSGSADGSSISAKFNQPSGITTDNAGNVYVADTGNHTIRKITSEGSVLTLAGIPGKPGLKDGNAAQAQFNHPSGIALDSNDNLYVADRDNGVIRRITPAGLVTTLSADDSVLTHSAEAPEPIGLDAPLGIAVDANGTLYVTDAISMAEESCAGAGIVRTISPDGRVSTLAGTTKVCGSADGMGTNARFNFPTGVAVSATGVLFVADTHNHAVRRISDAGLVSTVAGAARVYGQTDGTGAQAQFNSVAGITADSLGNLYVSDIGIAATGSSSLIRKLSPDHSVHTLSGKNGTGHLDGRVDEARFDDPTGLALDAWGNLYIADAGNAAIRRISPGGMVTTFAGLAGYHGSTDGPGTLARFHYPAAIAVDRQGNLYVADIHRATNGVYSGALRKISPDGYVSTLAGKIGESGAIDGAGESARFIYPSGIAVDSQNNIYVSDAMAHTVRRISSNGLVTTIAGSAGESGKTDGLGRDARFNHPAGLAIDEDGILYVADTLNHVVRMLGSDGRVTTIAGRDGKQGIVPGELPAALYRPSGLAMLAPKLLVIASGGSVLGLKMP